MSTITDFRAHCCRDRLADNHLQVATTLQSRLQSSNSQCPTGETMGQKNLLNVEGVLGDPATGPSLNSACSMVRDKSHCHCYILLLPGHLKPKEMGGNRDSTNFIWRGTMAW